MPVRIRDEDPGWRPTWAQMLDMVERYAHGDEQYPELLWLRAHPTDWLMVARYMRYRTEDHIAQTRKALKNMEVTDPQTGRPRQEYLQAKAEADKLNGKRLRWIAGLDEEIAEAKYLLGWERVPLDTRAELIAQLLQLRMMLSVNGFNRRDGADMVGVILRTYADENFDPDAYRYPVQPRHEHLGPGEG